MSKVVVESTLTGRRKEIEVSFDPYHTYSTFTFDVREKIGIRYLEPCRINEQIEYFCNVLIHPQVTNNPSILIRVRLVSSIDGVDGTLGYPVFTEVADPFSIPWETYLHLPIEYVDRLKERVWEENGDWIIKQIEELSADWILVCNRKVIEWSDNRKEYPSKERLEKIAKEYNVFPFVFVRPPLIEETSWNRIRGVGYKNDYYPTVKINICGKIDLIGDFDTGNQITALDIDQLNLRPSRITTFQKGRFLDKDYYYLNEPIHLQITDELGKKRSKEIRCDCVKDWKKSPFCKINPDRKALIGRDILLEFPIEVKLDGKKKKTYVYLL